MSLYFYAHTEKQICQNEAHVLKKQSDKYEVENTKKSQLTEMEHACNISVTL